MRRFTSPALGGYVSAKRINRRSPAVSSFLIHRDYVTLVFRDWPPPDGNANRAASLFPDFPPFSLFLTNYTRLFHENRSAAKDTTKRDGGAHVCPFFASLSCDRVKAIPRGKLSPLKAGSRECHCHYYSELLATTEHVARTCRAVAPIARSLLIARGVLSAV